MPREGGGVASPYTLSGSEWGKAPDRMRREKAHAPVSSADIRGQLQEGASNNEAQFEGRKPCLPFAISRMFSGLMEVDQLLVDGGGAHLLTSR